MISHREALSRKIVAISTSESPDMPTLGLSNQHLKDAMTEIARHLLAHGSRLVYGGDLREHGFTKLLLELVARHRREAKEGYESASVLNYLAWPVHIQYSIDELKQYSADLGYTSALVFLTMDGERMSMVERSGIPSSHPNEAEWDQGLTVLRKAMLADTNARIVLGGRVEGYKGSMPGIAQEALLSLQAKQSLFLLGGFGGCSGDIAETLGLTERWSHSQRFWSGRENFEAYTGNDLNNSLTREENTLLAHTPHVDQAVTLILRGLLNQSQTSS